MFAQIAVFLIVAASGMILSCLALRAAFATDAGKTGNQ
jgi:hypothetical protein